MNEKIFNEIYNELLVPMVHRYYNYDRKLYNSDMLDAEDLKQEIAIILTEKMKEGEKSKEELSRFVNTVIRTKLKQIKRNIVNRNGILFKVDNINGEGNLENIPIKNNKTGEFFEEIKEVCNEKEYEVLIDRFINKMTYEEIGKKNGFSKQRTGKYLKEILVKVKVFLNK